jgi:uncharacterized protein HemX
VGQLFWVRFSARGPVQVNLEILDDPIAQWVIWAALGAILIAVGVYVVGKIRAEVVQQEPTANELLSKFRDLHSKGELSDAEFRTIKTTLAARFQDELKDDGETG